MICCLLDRSAPRAELLFCFLPAAAVADFGLLVSVKKRHQALGKLKKTGKLVVDGKKGVFRLPLVTCQPFQYVFKINSKIGLDSAAIKSKSFDFGSFLTVKTSLKTI